MIALVALLGVAVISWLYRISFTALASETRLPPGLRARMDAISPAAFATLIATDVAGTPTTAIPGAVIALFVAGVVAWRTHNHLIAVLSAVVAWTVVSLW